MGEEERGATPATAAGVAERIVGEGLRYAEALDLIQRYADARVAEAVAKVREALEEIAGMEWAGIAGAGPAASRMKIAALEALAGLPPEGQT